MKRPSMNTNNPYFEKIIKSSRPFLSRWNGGMAEMWELTTSLKTLDVLIRREDKPGNLLISCGEPVMIRGPVRWMNCDLRVTTTISSIVIGLLLNAPALFPSGKPHYVGQRGRIHAWVTGSEAFAKSFFKGFS
jgi:hypothetical protein